MTSACRPAPGSVVAQSLRFLARPDQRMQFTQRGLAVPHADRRVTLVHFLDEDPRDRWKGQFGGNGKRVGDSGLGRLERCAPFVPVLHGTDRYTDGLR